MFCFWINKKQFTGDAVLGPGAPVPGAPAGGAGGDAASETSSGKKQINKTIEPFIFQDKTNCLFQKP